MKESALAKKYKVRGVPTLAYIKNGKVITKQLGVKTPKQLKNNVDKYFQ